MMNERFKHYLLGHETIDKDHSLILSSLDVIRRELAHKYDTDEHSKSTLKRILNLWNSHIKYEVEMMVRAKFGGIEGHVTSHKLVSANFDRALMYLSSYSVGALIEDILSHIDNFDRAFIDYLNKNEIAQN